MADYWRSIVALCLLASALATPAPANGSELISYTYDDRGRLVRVVRSGTVNDGIEATYSYDKADNRTHVTVSGPSFSVNDISATEGSSLAFSVTRTSTSAPAIVSYTTSGGTATAGSDYAATSGTLNFAIGEAIKPVYVTTVDDSATEPTESVNLTLSDPAGASIADGTGVGTINDNDVPLPCSGVSFTVASNGAVMEGAHSLFIITKNGAASGNCAVSYATTNGTAVAGSDYDAVSSALSFSSTQYLQAVSVPTIDDTAIESAETFGLALSSPTGGSVIGSPGSVTATINDGDSLCAGISFSVSNASRTGAGPLNFTISKAGSTSYSCSVNYATADGSAVAPGDYTAVSGTLTFTSTQASRTVTVNAGNPQFLTRRMYLNISAPTNGATISDGQGEGTIRYDDPCPLCLAGSGEAPRS